jgi:hypothetical protein
MSDKCGPYIQPFRLFGGASALRGSIPRLCEVVCAFVWREAVEQNIALWPIRCPARRAVMAQAGHLSTLERSETLTAGLGLRLAA